jgi:hypothetical protein
MGLCTARDERNLGNRPAGDTMPPYATDTWLTATQSTRLEPRVTSIDAPARAYPFRNDGTRQTDAPSPPHGRKAPRQHYTGSKVSARRYEAPQKYTTGDFQLPLSTSIVAAYPLSPAHYGNITQEEHRPTITDRSFSIQSVIEQHNCTANYRPRGLIFGSSTPTSTRY